MKRTLSFVFLAALGGALLNPTAASAGYQCEPPPSPTCVEVFDICVSAGDCLTCEDHEVLEFCGKCSSNPDDCAPEEICDRMAAACKAGNGEDCGAAYDACLALVTPDPQP